MPGLDPQVFGAYRVVRQLGAGGMGEVLLARQSSLPGVERLVVIKKVLPHLAKDPDFVRRFMDEARVASSLTHGNIVQVYESGDIDGDYFMVMEYVDGPDLRDLLGALRDRGERLPHALALHILIEISKALAYAHDRRDAEGNLLGLVHRDVSPANILLAYDGQVKLTDFGVAKAAARMSLSMPGTLHGKVFYVAPEQILGEPCDARSDLFSLGVVAYEMLAGRRPFEGESEVMVIEQVRRCLPPPLAEVAPWVPADLAAVVARAMARLPSDRHESAEALQADLMRILIERGEGMCSARMMADFLASTAPAGRSQPPVRTPAPTTPPRASALDAAAEGLLRSPITGGDASERTRSIVRGQTPTPAVSTSLTRSRLVRYWWVLLVVLATMAGTTAVLTWPHGNGALEGMPDDAIDSRSGDQEAPPAVLPLLDVSEKREGVAPPEPPETMPRRDPAWSDTPPRTVVSLRSTPKGAEVFHGARRLGTTPIDVTLPKGGPMRLEVRMDGHESRTVTVGPDSSSSVTVSLVPLEMGRVKFRFFPANAVVMIDGTAMSLSGNVADLLLPAGAHTLTLRAAEGDVSRVTRFQVRASETTALGTIELSLNPEDTP